MTGNTTIKSLIDSDKQNGRVTTSSLIYGVIANQEALMNAIDPQKQAEKSEQAVESIHKALASVNAAAEVVNASEPIMEELKRLGERMDTIDRRLDALSERSGCCTISWAETLGGAPC